MIWQFQYAFSTIREGWADMSALKLGSLEDLVEATEAALDDVWRAECPKAKYAYPQARMAHMFDVVGSSLIQVVQKVLGQRDLWRHRFVEIKADLTVAAAVLDKWHQAVGELTGRFWPSVMTVMSGKAHPILLPLPRA